MQPIRSLFLSLSQHEWLHQMAKKYGLKYGASRFVAGVELQAALEVVQELNQGECMVRSE